MSNGLSYTLGQPWMRARRTNCTDNGFPSKLITATEPSGIGDNAAQATAASVFKLTSKEGGVVQNAVMIRPYGAGANDATMSVRLYAWNRLIEGGDDQKSIWVPTLLVQLACTLSSTDIGLANKTLLATDLFADTLTLTTGNDDISVDIVSPTGDVGAHAVVDLKGAQLLELTFTTGGSATNCNALIRMF